MLKKILVSIMIISLIGTFMPQGFIQEAFAQENSSVKMEVIDNPVSYKTSAYEPWQEVTGEMDIAPGYYVNAGKGGTVLFYFPDGSKVRLYESSMIRLQEVRTMGEIRNYHFRFLGKLLAQPVENAKGDSYFFDSAPIAEISSDGKEFTAEVETDLFVRVVVIEGSATATDAFNIDGKIKELYPEKSMFDLEVANEDGEPEILAVKVYPHTIFFQKYPDYRKSGEPSALGSLEEDLEAGQNVVVFGELKDKDATSINFAGKVLHASLITDRNFLPPVWWEVVGPQVMSTTVITAGAAAAIGAVVLGVILGGDDPIPHPVTNSDPNTP